MRLNLIMVMTVQSLASKLAHTDYHVHISLRPTLSTKLTRRTFAPRIWYGDLHFPKEKELRYVHCVLIPEMKKKRERTQEIESNQRIPSLISYCIFLCIRRWSCHDQTARKTRRPTPTTDQELTNQRGIGFGYNPVKLTMRNTLEARTMDRTMDQ